MNSHNKLNKTDDYNTNKGIRYLIHVRLIKVLIKD